MIDPKFIVGALVAGFISWIVGSLFEFVANSVYQLDPVMIAWIIAGVGMSAYVAGYYVGKSSKNARKRNDGEYINEVHIHNHIDEIEPIPSEKIQALFDKPNPDK